MLSKHVKAKPTKPWGRSGSNSRVSALVPFLITVATFLTKQPKEWSKKGKKEGGKERRKRGGKERRERKRKRGKEEEGRKGKRGRKRGKRKEGRKRRREEGRVYFGLKFHGAVPHSREITVTSHPLPRNRESWMLRLSSLCSVFVQRGTPDYRMGLLTLWVGLSTSINPIRNSLTDKPKGFPIKGNLDPINLTVSINTVGRNNPGPSTVVEKPAVRMEAGILLWNFWRRALKAEWASKHSPVPSSHHGVETCPSHLIPFWLHPSITLFLFNL